MTKKRIVVSALLSVLIAAVVFSVGLAQEEEGGEATNGLSSTSVKAIAAGFAFFGSTIATGWAQSRTGAAMAGALAEDSSLGGTAIIMIAIPETAVILGFVTALVISG